MRRRTILKIGAAATAFGVAGCVHQEGDGLDDGSTVTVESFSSSVMQDGDARESASYSFEDGGLHVTGVILGSDACKDADLDSVEYEDGRLVFDVVTVDAEDAGDACAEVLTPIRYEAVVEITYQVQPAVVVRHDGEEVEATEGTGEGGGGEVGALTGSEFEVVEQHGEYEESAEATWNEDDGSLTVEGVIEGSNLCYTAELEDAELLPDSLDEQLRVSVRSFEDAAEDEMCGQQMVGVGYSFTAEFEGGLPSSVYVVHSTGWEQEIQR